MGKLIILFAVANAGRRWRDALGSGSSAQINLAHHHFLLVVALANGQLNGPWYVDASTPEVRA